MRAVTQALPPLGSTNAAYEISRSNARARRRTRTLPPPRGSQNSQRRCGTAHHIRPRRYTGRAPPSNNASGDAQAPKLKSLARSNKTRMGCSGSNNLAGDLIAWPWKCRRRQSDHTPLGWRRRHRDAAVLIIVQRLLRLPIPIPVDGRQAYGPRRNTGAVILDVLRCDPKSMGL